MTMYNGSVEGLNNKAKVISHEAYGFRSARNIFSTAITVWLIYHKLNLCIHLCAEPYLLIHLSDLIKS